MNRQREIIAIEPLGANTCSLSQTNNEKEERRRRGGGQEEVAEESRPSKEGEKGRRDGGADLGEEAGL